MKIRNIITVSFVLAIVISQSNKMMVQATGDLQSNGRIIFNNEDESQGDKLIIFDAADLVIIQNRLSELDNKIEEVRNTI